MGRYAGYDVISDLFDRPLLPPSAPSMPGDRTDLLTAGAPELQARP